MCIEKVAWPSGQARVCKTFYGGSNPSTTSHRRKPWRFSYGKQSLDGVVFLYDPFFIFGVRGRAPCGLRHRDGGLVVHGTGMVGLWFTAPCSLLRLPEPRSQIFLQHDRMVVFLVLRRVQQGDRLFGTMRFGEAGDGIVGLQLGQIAIFEIGP